MFLKKILMTKSSGIKTYARMDKVDAMCCSPIDFGLMKCLWKFCPNFYFLKVTFFFTLRSQMDTEGHSPRVNTYGHINTLGLDFFVCLKIFLRISVK